MVGSLYSQHDGTYHIEVELFRNKVLEVEALLPLFSLFLGI